MTIFGKATPVGTKRQAQNFPALAYAPLGSTQLLASEVGFGSYRIDSTPAAHRDSLIYALQNGINLIDTSANYTDGRSETLIGE
ncbi:MAG: aldo/keto reductase, partial [Anaerolineales bacterium]|nr:aldo/keto reductase [Anaerolineales bacterium]